MIEIEKLKIPESARENPDEIVVHGSNLISLVDKINEIIEVVTDINQRIQKLEETILYTPQ